MNLIDNGIELIEASQLAGLQKGRFVARDYNSFNAYWPKLHPKFGRWFCWHAFSVGAESVLKGVYAAKGLTAPHLGASQSWNKLGIPLEQHSKLNYDMKLLAKRRNEGAHEFALGVRDGYFTEVENRYVPALNSLLIAIDYAKV